MSNWHDEKNTIHDHFDGSAHCVECQGKCKLTGADLALTQLVRYMFAAWAWSLHGQKPNHMTCVVLKDLGVDLDATLARAKESNR